MKGTILVLESDSELRRVLSLHLEQLKWRVLQSKTVDFALHLLDRDSPDILVVDADSANPRADELVKQFRDHGPEGAPGLVFLTAIDRLGRESLHRCEVDVVLYKPFDVRHLSRKIDSLFEERTQ
jgi:DNA-binding response OmpR family regulator